MKALMLLLLLALTLVLSSSHSHLTRALAGRALAQLPPQQAAQNILQYSAAHLAACLPADHGNIATLTRAIVSIEFVNQRRLEAAVEHAGITLLSKLRLPLPDWSLGPAQIKLTTLCDQLSQLPECATLTSRQQLAQQLLQPCPNIDYAQQLVQHWWRPELPQEQAVRAVAKRYNGQLTDSLENRYYQELVLLSYQLLQAQSADQSW
ncbi:hypothetical protein [uncultured Ferrimonas sp.]|uniref:hypothetical protein n=1 Tax=uncultured Ferrimonas sp. TaxID=432640 RepID=UPI0026048D84|nr:hypothetical protein [uncultured Ferrimonas sp.]